MVESDLGEYGKQIIKDLDEKFIHLLHLKTGKSVEKIREATELIKKGQDPYASVMQSDLIKMNKLLDEILPH